MLSNQNEISSSDTSTGFNIKKVVFTYLKQWKWFVLSCLICVGITYAKLRYTTPQYAAVAKIMLLDESEGTSASNAFSDLSIFADGDEAKVEDEIQVIKSRSFLRNIVNKLNLNIQFFTKGRVYDTELYKYNSPVDISFIASDSIISRTNFSFNIEIVSNTEFNYRIHEEDSPKRVAFGQEIQTFFGGMIITPIKVKKGNTIRVKITPVEYLAESLKSRINVAPTGKASKVVNISMKDPIVEKAKDILNTLIDEYNRSTIEKQNTRSTNRADFIDKRIELIAKDLGSVDDSIVYFKTGNKVTDVTSEAGQFLSSNALNEQQLDASRMQLRQLNYMKESLGDGGGNTYNSIPSNLGMGDPAISSLSANYNELIAKRDNFLKDAGANNPTVKQLEETIKGVRQSLDQNIDNATKSLNITLSGLQNQSDRINSKIRSVPGQERRLRSIERKQGLKESLYLYLLQKREEATISLTATSPSAKIIDEAYNSKGGPVSPNKRLAYIAALFIGLLIPFLIIYLADLLDTKIHNKEDLEKEIKDIIVIGEVPKVRRREKSLIERNDRSILSESFRIIRTNFDHVKKGRNVKDYNNVVFVTSTINGEGKSFFSLNMALTLANTNKKVLLIGADIRNPQIFSAIKQKTKEVESKLGLTEYLADSSIAIHDSINEYNINNIKLDILLSGKVPPNPAELLMNDRLKELFDSVSNEYDYVIVDTAPSMLVTDTLLISKYAGHTIYLTRAEYTEKRILNFTKELYANKKLNSMMLVVNDVKQSNFGYGAKYGYYGAQKKGLFKKNKSA